MQRKSLPTIPALFLVFALIFTGCGSAPAAEAQPADDSAAALAEQPAVEETQPTAAPTEAPEPIPCNVVFDSDRDGNWEIYIMGPDGENPTNLSNNPADDWNPAISPDGSRVAFVSYRETKNGGGQFIYVMNADGSNIQQLTFEENCDFPDWSPDGSMIVYSSNGDIYFTDANDGSSPTRLTDSPENDISPTWSPDGGKIAWLSGQEGAMNVIVAGQEGQDMHPVTDNGRINRVEWTVDGRIFVDSWGWSDREEFCHNCLVTPDGVDIEDAGGKGEVQRFLPFWNGNGDRVEIIETSLDDGPSEIYLVGEIFPDIFYNMTDNPASDRHPDWPANCGPDFVPAVQSGPVEPAPQADAQQAVDPQDIVIGYVGDTSEQKLADLLQACNELGIQCVKGASYAELTEQGVDAIIAFSNKWSIDGDFPLYHEAADKGFPIYFLDAEADVYGPYFYNFAVESDALRGGLEWMFAQMGGQGEMVYFNFGPNNFEENLIQQELASNPGIQAAAIPATHEDMSVASQENIVAMMASQPEIGAIWANEMREDIFWAVNGMQGDHYPAILCSERPDILQGWKALVTEHPAFSCYTTIKPGGNAYEAVYVAYYRLNGMELDPAALGGEFGNTLLYDYPIITNDNLDEWLGKIGDLRVVQNDTLELPPMTPEEIRDKWFLD